jgi:hypothetical protein
MSASLTRRMARRPFLAGVLGIFGVAVAGAAAYEGMRLFGRRYPRTKFDDLLDQLPDRESAAKLGRAALTQAEAHTIDVAPEMVAATAARELRTGPGKGSLARAVDADIAQGRLVALQGWLLPTSLVAVATIAASVQQSS